MAQQAAHRHLHTNAILQQFIFEIVFCLLYIITSAAITAIIGIGMLVAVHLNIITIDQENGRILSQELL